MRIALVYPESYEIAHHKNNRKEFPPFGVLYLAAVAEKEGYEVQIFKVNNQNKVFDFSTFDVVGFSIASSYSYNLIKDVRNNSCFSSQAFLVAGGIHATLFPENSLMDLKLDLVFIGESENSLIHVLSELPDKDFSKIKGICYLNEAGELVIRINSELVYELDKIPFPARHLIDENDFIMTDRLSNTNIRMAHVLVSRGCPFNCYFCGNLYKNIRYRSPENVREELLYLINTYKIEGFAITDDNFIVNKKNVIEICNGIKDLELKWSALSRLDTLDEEVLWSMHDAGCIEIKFGVESGNEDLLKSMNKTITREKIISAINLTKKMGYMVKIFLIHGFPGENIKTSNDTISLLQECGKNIDRVSLFRFVPLPGSYVYNNPEKYFLNIKNVDLNNYHIYYNDCHWWGNTNDFNEMCKGYEMLRTYICNTWGSC